MSNMAVYIVTEYEANVVIYNARKASTSYR